MITENNSPAINPERKLPNLTQLAKLLLATSTFFVTLPSPSLNSEQEPSKDLKLQGTSAVHLILRTCIQQQFKDKEPLFKDEESLTQQTNKFREKYSLFQKPQFNTSMVSEKTLTKFARLKFLFAQKPPESALKK